MAQLVTPYPTLDSKSPCQGLSESVVGFSGTFHFTRLDSGEQWVVDVTLLYRRNKNISWKVGPNFVVYIFGKPYFYCMYVPNFKKKEELWYT